MKFSRKHSVWKTSTTTQPPPPTFKIRKLFPVLLFFKKFINVPFHDQQNGNEPSVKYHHSPLGLVSKITPPIFHTIGLYMQNLFEF